MPCAGVPSQGASVRAGSDADPHGRRSGLAQPAPCLCFDFRASPHSPPRAGGDHCSSEHLPDPGRVHVRGTCPWAAHLWEDTRRPHPPRHLRPLTLRLPLSAHPSLCSPCPCSPPRVPSVSPARAPLPLEPSGCRFQLRQDPRVGDTEQRMLSGSLQTRPTAPDHPWAGGGESGLGLWVRGLQELRGGGPIPEAWGAGPPGSGVGVRVGHPGLDQGTWLVLLVSEGECGSQ